MCGAKSSQAKDIKWALRMAWRSEMGIKINDYDVSEHLRTPEEMAAYLEASITESDGDAAFVAKALGDIARAKGMAALAHETGLGRESLYKALSAEGNPQLSTVLKVAKAPDHRVALKELSVLHRRYLRSAFRLVRSAQWALALRYAL
jgi:probable addiction module antidote protein